jgi:hypothetical protein
MSIDCVLNSLRIAQVDPDDEPLSEVVLSHKLPPPFFLLALAERRCLLTCHRSALSRGPPPSHGKPTNGRPRFHFPLITWAPHVDIPYAALQAHGIINVALQREYSLGIIFIFSQGRKDLYHV